MLTARHVEVLTLCTQGLTADQIATRLFITSGTVKKHLKEIRFRLDAANTVHAVALAMRRGIVTYEEAA